MPDVINATADNEINICTSMCICPVKNQRIPLEFLSKETDTALKVVYKHQHLDAYFTYVVTCIIDYLHDFMYVV